MKRIWSLLLAAVLLCALCAPAMAQEEKITLEFWERSYGNDDRYTETCEKLIAQYEAENPNVTINMTYQPWDNYYQLFLTAVSSGAAPDVASCAIDQPDLFAQTTVSALLAVKVMVLVPSVRPIFSPLARALKVMA